ncbi:hypothetical protein [Corynebacterium kozikiae]|uniref:hypothetical protein n=1 Tax=Corynebacterium kozikiae TaxID=2968469 RepID=UPI00211BCFC8|nr:hypothetical protein [Corynebacterium sp. 76QC2CO]MCQ9343886.1 hypothetical protein [Corynebacterium sp. 76QC2CO]
MQHQTPKPVPGDPRAQAVDPDELVAQVEAIFSEPTDGPTEELEQLQAAHAILNNALK